jgi:rhomboid protease GluP
LSRLKRPDVVELTLLMRSPLRQVPVTVGLIAINLSVYFLMLWQEHTALSSVHNTALAWGANFGPATQNGQWWRLLTAPFVHFSLPHIAVNMWALWDIGRLVERLMGRLRFALLYLAAGALGNLLVLVVHGSELVSAGASGAIFGLYGVLLVYLCVERRRLDPLELRWMLTGTIVFTVLMLSLGYFVSGIDNAAHGGGLIFGVLLGGVLLPASPASGSPAARVGSFSVVSFVGLVGIFLAIPGPRYRYQEELQTRAAIAQFAHQEVEITRNWNALLVTASTLPTSFDEISGVTLAEAIDAQVSAPYQLSFEQLSAVRPISPVPSGSALVALQAYAVQRKLAARAMSAGLRAGDIASVQTAQETAATAYRQAHASHPSASTSDP